MTRITEFTNKYGNGKNKLSEANKKNRIEKIIGNEQFKKLKISGKQDGIELKHYNSPNWESGNDPLEEIKNKLNNFPDDTRGQNHKILNIQVNDNGSGFIEGIIINGKEKDVKKRALYSIEFVSDEEQAKFEKKQYLDDKLKEIMDRTMAIHNGNGDWETFVNDPEINTNPDEDGDI